MIKKYRQKPVEVEAIQFDGSPESAVEITRWLTTHGIESRFNRKTITIHHSKYYNIEAFESDWVLVDLQDNLPEVQFDFDFKEQYESAE